jgi:Xaa-Pro aminopeptidase
MSDRDLGLPVSEYAKRREKVLRALNGATGLVLAGDGTASSYGPGSSRQTDSHFWYLTGLDQETGAAVLFDPSSEDPDRKITLFLRPRDPEAERWNGARSPLDSALRAKTGFSHLARTTSLPARLTDAARRTRRLACLHPFASYEADLSPDLVLFKKVCERIPTVALEDLTQVLPAMRAVKSTAELALMERAVAITTAGYATALRSIRPGVNESDIADTMTAAFRELGGMAAFEPIVGSGASGTILHYSANDQVVRDGDLIVIDYAAAYAGYAADVTRTLPANGKFTPEQRRLYEVVLRANFAATLAAVPGATFTDLQQAARAVIAKAGHEDDYLHGVGHHLGIEVHDVTPDGPLAPGMVLTIEPGIYLADKGIGIRIEDDVLITKSGPKVLTAAIPKTVEAIEAAMACR